MNDYAVQMFVFRVYRVQYLYHFVCKYIYTYLNVNILCLFFMLYIQQYPLICLSK